MKKGGLYNISQKRDWEDQALQYFWKKLRFKYILGSQETRNKTTSHHLPYLPFLSSLHLLRVSLQLDYISLTIALPFSLYKSTFKFWGVTKTWLRVAAAVHWQVFLDLDPILVGQASFTIAILATAAKRQVLQKQNPLLTFVSGLAYTYLAGITCECLL